MELTGECSRRSGGSQHKHAKELFDELALLFDQKDNNEKFENVKEDTSGKLINGPYVQMEAYDSAYIESEMYGTYAFVNMEDGQEEDDELKKSKRNIVEAAVVLHMLSKLCKVCAHREGPMISVGVISPYSAQVSYLKSTLMKNNKWRNNIDVEVRMLDEFQTGEKDIIIISTVNTNNIGILSDCRRAYIALKCARFCVWIVGNGSMFLKSKSIWEKLAKDAIARNCFVDPNKDSGMVKVIRNAKAEIKNLQDLFKTDSVLFNNAHWKVTFSSDFKNSFTQLKDLHVRQHIINTILKLANGWRKKWKHAGCAQKDLINEYATSGLYLVWTTDVERQEEVMQVLKIWNVLNLVEVSRLRTKLELLFATYTPQYIERCKAKFLDKNAKTVLPRRWKDDPDFVWYKHLQHLRNSETIHPEGSEKEAFILEHGKVEESLLLMKFYSLSSGIANQLLTAKDGSEIDLQFEVNDEESRIIRFPRSSFILGRSGTGKTTVLTARLLQKEQQFNLSIHGFSTDKQTKVESTIGREDLQREDLNSKCLRQMFITVSARLCSEISNHISPIDKIYLANCNETRIEDAGDCFAEAKAWYDAAIAYARAKCLDKCLNACSKGKHFEVGLKLIQELKEEKCRTNCGRCVSCQRIEVKVEYLRTGAIHFHYRKDTISMMKFVKAFPTLDLVRSFLLDKDYLDELLQIEVANGDFLRAAEVAAMKGDLLLAADILQKGEKYEQAIKVILFYVQLNSLWGMKNRGWPLRKFPEKNKLLGKVKRMATQNLGHVPKDLDCKVSILSNESHNLSKITEQMILAQVMGSLNFEVLSFRKILDVHIGSDAKIFHHGQVGSLIEVDYNSKMLLENRVSTIAMMFIWNAWKDRLLLSVDSFTKLENRPEKEKDKVYIEFAYEYFGARVSRKSCTVFKSEAFWLKNKRIGLLQRKGNCAWISIEEFFIHAREFLLMELFSVGIEVVKKLQEIHLSCRNQRCICKGTQILQIYQDLKSLEERELVRFDQPRDELFFDIFFPLKSQYGNLKELMSLRKSPTCTLILKDITVNIIRKIHGGINLGQIGRLQLLLPYLPKDLVREYGKKVIKSLDHNNCWNNELLWLNMGIITGVCLPHRRLCMIECFLEALHGTFKIWHSHTDYISPHVFLLLLEKLFFLSSSEHLSRSLFLPRCFFVEFMTGEQRNSSCSWLLQSQCLPRCHGRLENFYGPIFDIICELLITNKAATFSWMETFKISIRTYFPEIAMRLIIMLTLIGVNSIHLYQDAIHAIRTILQDRDITNYLPSDFGGKLFQSLNNSNGETFSIDICRLMRDIDNPLVMIDLENDPKFSSSYSDFIVLGVDSIVSKKILFQTIFQDQGYMVDLNEKGRHANSKEVLIHGGNNMQPSNANNSITNTEYPSDSLIAREKISTNAENIRSEQENESTPTLGSNNIDEHKLDDSFGVEERSREESILFSLLESNKLSLKFGLSLSLFVQWRMKRWLSCAKSRLGKPLSCKDKYIREVCRAFLWNRNSSYAETFFSKACPLKAEVDELLDLIDTTIPKLKHGKVQHDEEIDVLKETHDIHEKLSHLSELLCPRHEKHEECDLEWLQNYAIGHISINLQEILHRLDRLKSLFEDDIQTVTECIQQLSTAQP